MPIARLGGGPDFRKAGPDVKDKINEIVDWINALENAQITPSDCGALHLPRNIDLSGCLTKHEAATVDAKFAFLG